MSESTHRRISTISNERKLYLQWEKPKGWLAKKFPYLARTWPWRLRYFVFRADKENAALIPAQKLNLMTRKAEKYLLRT